MGIVLSRFRSNLTTKERLEQIEGEIQLIDDYKWTTIKQQKNHIGLLFFVSGLIYIASALIFYFYYLPRSSTWQQKLLYSLPLVVFPIVVWMLQRSLKWYYRWAIDVKEDRLRELKKEKRKILDKVMETETYKVAKELLEKYDPKALKDKNEAPSTPLTQAYADSLRYRGTPLSSARSFSTPSMNVNRFPNTGMNRPPLPPLPPQQRLGAFISTPRIRGPNPPPMQPRLALMQPPTPRPILPQNRGVMEKIVDYVVGDGPSNRYALICHVCHSHNGMVLKEEFEYTPFRCCYCFTFNPSRKERPFAPKLEPRPSSSRGSLAPVVDEPESDSDSSKRASTNNIDADTSKMQIEDVTSDNDADASVIAADSKKSESDKGEADSTVGGDTADDGNENDNANNMTNDTTIDSENENITNDSSEEKMDTSAAQDDNEKVLM